MDVLYRRNAVLEALRGRRRRLHRLWLEEGMAEREARPFLEAAEARAIPVSHAPRQKLNNLAQNSSHQGAVLEADPYPYSDLYEMMELAAARKERPLLLLLDLLHGPQNIGALLRTAEICGVHGVFIQDRRAPEITPTVVTYSVGATEHLLIAQVTNLVAAMKEMKEQDVWLAGLDLGEEAYTLGEIGLDRALGIVVGHEGRGMRRLVRETCDFLLRLPMRGRVESFNAAVAGSIIIFEAWQARGFPAAGGN